ncbi:EAL domain-containing protein [Castellaniella sp. GW247-6E4]|uniref:EAL domain-containing protein n=1 Tax=Castellaniella sp. GW247-6E4 TaxID=3140380 RepID=UPI003315AC68
MSRLIAYYLTPLAILLGTAVALFALNNLYPDTAGTPLAIRVLPDTQAPPETAAEALGLLDAAPTRYRARLETEPAWFLVEIPAKNTQAGPQVLSLPNPHGLSLSCWDAAALSQPIGTLAGDAADGQLRLGLDGPKIGLQGLARPGRLICETQLAIAGDISADLWQGAALSQSANRLSRAIGLAEGGLLTLALFIAIIALTNREWLYILLAAWLIGNLRLGAWVMGWDMQWLGHTIPPDLMPGLRKGTAVAYYILTCSLFTRLFDHSLTANARAKVLLAARTSSVALIAAALVLPYEWFQPVLFLAAWLGSGLITVTLLYALLRSPSRIWLWHITGLCLALATLLLGLVLTALGQGGSIDTLAGATILIAAGVMIALAAAEHMREERQSGFRARNELIVADTLMPFGLFTLNSSHLFEHANAVARQSLGLPDEQDYRGRPWADFFPVQDWHQVARNTELGVETEIRMLPHLTQPGPARSFLLRATLAGGQVEGSLQDISARAETIRKLRLMAENDPLTDALNRRGIESATEQCITQLVNEGTPCALAFLSLDHLKHINDTFGHTAGDELLQMVCERLKYSLNESQRLGRVGSDEFVILFPKLRASEARHIGQDIIDSLNGSALYIGNRAFQIKSAMGIIDIHQNMNPKDAISAASRACRDARKQHTEIMLYEENASELFDHIEELRLFDQLEAGANPRDIYLEMQPIISLKHPLRTLNIEILLRARSSDTTSISTSKIIQAAEDNGMIGTIDKWVFSATLEWMTRHQGKLSRTQQVNVNLSGVSLNDDKFIDVLFGILNRHPQLTRRLCIEITEGVALQDLERTRQFMRRLQRMGAKVALDDFGAGYTSFSYLKELPVDIIKIDGSLIRDMIKSEANIAIVNSIVELAHNLGMECIAEWVEDVPTLEALVGMGMDHVQGHILSAARPPSEILANQTVLPLIADERARTFIQVLSDRHEHIV